MFSTRNDVLADLSGVFSSFLDSMGTGVSFFLKKDLLFLISRLWSCFTGSVCSFMCFSASSVALISG